MQNDRPKIGIGVIVRRSDKILIGERISSHGSGTFQIPGGHLEFGETFADTALREVREETGLTDLIFKEVVSISNDITYDKHYVSIGILVDCLTGDPFDAEPDHSQNWHWRDPRDLPEPMFINSKRVVGNWLQGTIFNT